MLDAAVVPDAVARFPGHVALHVDARASVDWRALQATVRARGVELEAFDANDAAANVLALAGEERADEGTADPARRAQWQHFAANDRDARVQRSLLVHVDRLTAASARAGDPRLTEVAAIAAAEREFWRLVAPLAPTQPAEVAATDAASTAIGATRALLAERREDGAAGVMMRTTAFRRWVAGRLAWQRIGERCGEIAADAARKAARTRDAAMAQRYRELATRCRDLRDAVALLLQPPW